MSVSRVVVLAGLALAVACGERLSAGEGEGSGGAAGENSSSGGRRTQGHGDGGSGEAAAGGGSSSGGSTSSGASANQESGGSGTGSDSHSDGGGTGSGDGGSGNGSMAALDFCEAYGDALCQQRTSCGMTDCETWNGYLFTTRECRDAVASLEEGFVSYDGEAALGCVAAFEDVSCASNPPFRDSQVVAACAGVFTGKVALGGRCESADFENIFDECAEGFCLRASTGGSSRECLGTCSAYRAQGESCSTYIPCASGLNCVNAKCETLGGLNADCSTVPCQAGLACSEISPVTCRAPVPVGSTCGDSGDCETPAVCVNSKCMTGVGVGSYCRGDSCANGLYCRGAAQIENQICATPLALGATCNDLYDQCANGNVCSYFDSTCAKPYGALNEPCGPQGCEEDLYCSDSNYANGTCHPRGAEGDVCPGWDSCLSGLLCMSDGKCHAPGRKDGPCLPDYYTSCQEGFFCSWQTGLCKSPAAIGEDCNSYDPLNTCQSGSYCPCLEEECPNITSPHPNDVCKVQKADGVGCSSAWECLGGYCIGSPAKCASAPDPATSCSR